MRFIAGSPPPRSPGWREAVRSFDLQREDLLAIIDGMEMDVIADIRAPDRATLDLYCDRVACAVGGFRCACSAWSTTPAVRSRIIWAGAAD